MASQPRDLGVDLLRAVCILYIVGYWHLLAYASGVGHWANLYSNSLTRIALATFVFCAGYLLAAHPVPLTRAGLGDFYRRRLLRIYPLFLLALLLFWAFGITTPDKLMDGALLVSMFRPPVLPTLWFVTMIMLFYLVAPVVIRAAARPWAWAALTAAVTLLIALWHRYGAPIDLRLLLYWPVFALAVLYRRQTWPGELVVRLWPWLAVALVPALWLAQHGAEDRLIGIPWLWPVTLLGMLLLFQAAPALARRLPSAPILFVAYAAYALYLLHRVTFKLAIGLYFPAPGWGQVWYLWLLVLPATLLLAWGLQRGYDRLLARATAPRGQQSPAQPGADGASGPTGRPAP